MGGTGPLLALRKQLNRLENKRNPKRVGTASLLPSTCASHLEKPLNRPEGNVPGTK